MNQMFLFATVSAAGTCSNGLVKGQITGLCPTVISTGVASWTPNQLTPTSHGGWPAPSDPTTGPSAPSTGLSWLGCLTCDHGSNPAPTQSHTFTVTLTAQEAECAFIEADIAADDEASFGVNGQWIIGNATAGVGWWGGITSVFGGRHRFAVGVNTIEMKNHNTGGGPGGVFVDGIVSFNCFRKYITKTQLGLIYSGVADANQCSAHCATFSWCLRFEWLAVSATGNGEEACVLYDELEPPSPPMAPPPTLPPPTLPAPTLPPTLPPGTTLPPSTPPPAPPSPPEAPPSSPAAPLLPPPLVPLDSNSSIVIPDVASNLESSSKSTSPAAGIIIGIASALLLLCCVVLALLKRRSQSGTQVAPIKNAGGKVKVPHESMEQFGLEAERAIARQCVHVKLHVVARRIELLQPIIFYGSKHAQGVDVYKVPKTAEAICEEVAIALQICNDLLVEHGLPSLALCVEGHTSALIHTADESLTISTLRAKRCETSIKEHVRARQGTHKEDQMWGQPLDAMIIHAGYGSTQPLPGFDDGGNHEENRRVEMRLLEPGSALYTAAATQSAAVEPFSAGAGGATAGAEELWEEAQTMVLPIGDSDNCYKTLTITDIAAFNVPGADARFSSGTFDAYVRFHIVGAEDKYVHTSTQVNTKNPIWEGETLMLTLPSGFKKGQLLIHVWDEDEDKEDGPLAKEAISVEIEKSNKPQRAKLKGCDYNGQALPDVDITFKYVLD